MWRKFKAIFTQESAESLAPDPVTIELLGTTYRLRPMTEQDIDAALVIEREIYHDLPWDRLAFMSELRRVSRNVYLVLTTPEDGVVAFIGSWFTQKEAHITNIAVAPSFQHRGIGRFLMQLMLDRAKAYGSEKMTLEVRTDNEVAKHLYTQLGFLPGKIKKGYYVSTHGDALDMWQTLETEGDQQ
ncbi:ribosomal protein S18-alanine N-acetyltransferase [Lacticaseibacillus brantae]|nr:ribosomal protein S18-alanine N-acetyltransferase [Lacticaseibacillus brantae]